MQKSLLFGIVGLLIGGAIGFYVANALNKQEVRTTNLDLSPQGANIQQQTTVNTGGMQADVSATLEAAESQPQSFAAQMKAGDTYAQIGRFDQAVEFYKRGLLINPNNVQANIVLANALFDSQKFDEAEGYYAKALQIDPKNPDATADFGATFVERPSPDYDRAIKEFKKALEIEPNHAPAIYYLGIANLRKGDRKAAEGYYAELEQKHPGNLLTGKLKQNLDASSQAQ